jgi:hypothetical protein
MICLVSSRHEPADLVLTPPSGFAVLQVQSVAAKKDYKDRVTGENIRP